MQRLKTREEISRQVYLNKADIKMLFGITDTPAGRIYDLAEKLDIEQLGKFRVEFAKVRITSACKVSGITLQTLQRQASNQEAKKKALAEVPIALTKG